MKEKQVNFYSDGLKLDASFFLPDDAAPIQNKPLVLSCSGFLGLKNIHPARFSRALTKYGYPCFGFDYRGFGKSEGEWKDILMEEFVQDVTNAIVFVSSFEEYAQNGVVVLGWGMGGGLVLEAAKTIPYLKGIITVNGFYNAKRVQKEVRGSTNWRKFYERIQSERLQETKTGKVKEVDPFEIYPLDETTRGYVENVLKKEEGFGGKIKFTFALSLLRFRPETYLSELKNIPLLIAHGENNDLHPPSEPESLYEKYPGKRELYWLLDAGHTEWMFDDNEKFRGLIKKIDKWITTVNSED